MTQKTHYHAFVCMCLLIVMLYVLVVVRVLERLSHHTYIYNYDLAWQIKTESILIRIDKYANLNTILVRIGACALS